MKSCRPMLAAILVTVLTVVGVGFTGVSTAHAEESEGAPGVYAPSLTLSMVKITNGTHVCFSGTAVAPGAWSMGINGARWSTDPNKAVPSQISFGAGLPPSTSFSQCHDVLTQGYQHGEFYVYGLFQGGTTATTTVARPGSLSGVVAWYPVGDDIHFQTTGG